MTFGTTPDTLFYEIILLLAALPLCIVLLFVGGLLRRLLPIDSALVSIVVTLLPLVGVIVGASLYLDRAGVVVPAQVVQKTETVHFRKEGDWRHAYQVQVNYTTPDGAAPTARFATTAAVFDSLREGGATQVRTVSIHGWFNLVRLADQSTWRWLPWRWIGIGLAVLLLGWVGWQFFHNKVGCVLLLAVALVIFVIPFALKVREWQRSENPALTPLHATGVISEVARVTTVDPLSGDGGDGDEWETEIEVAQQYDIVVVRYTPQGYSEPVLGVDAIDAGPQPLTPAMVVAITYAPTDPRTVRLAHGTRSHHWQNPLEWLKQQALAGGVVLALLGALHWGGRWLQRLLRRR